MTRRKNKLWMYYNKLNTIEATCKLCQKTIKTSGNTSNMLKHLRLRHPNYTGSVDKIEAFIQKEIAKTTNAKIKIERSIEYVDNRTDVTSNKLDSNNDNKGLTSLREPSSVTSGDTDIIEFVPFINENEECINTEYQIDDMLALDDNNGTQAEQQLCNIENEYVFGQADDQQQQNRKLVRLLLYFICTDKQPLESIIGNTGFNQLFNMLCPLYKLPSPQDLQTTLERFHALQSNKLCKLFTAAQLNLSLSCSLWQHDKTDMHYFDVTAHFIEEETTTLRHQFLAAYPLPDEFNSIHLFQCLEKICQKFHIQTQQIMCMVSDDDENIIEAASNFVGPEKYLKCFATTLKQILVAVHSIDNFKKLLTKVRTIVKYFKLNNYATEQLLEHQLEQPLQLLLDDKHNMISFYYMLERYVQLSNDVYKILTLNTSASNVPEAISQTELDAIKEILKVFKPLEYVLTEIGQTKYITQNEVIPIVTTLQMELKKLRIYGFTKLPRQILWIIQKELEMRFINIEWNPLMANACILDPRFKHLPFNNAEIAANYITDLNNLHKHQDFEQTLSPANSQDDATYDFWADYRVKQIKKTNMDKVNEIDMYFASDVTNLEIDAIQQWQNMQKLYPFLYEKAKAYLHMPAVALPFGGYYSSKGYSEIKQKRNLECQHINQILFLSDCTKNEWNI